MEPSFDEAIKEHLELRRRNGHLEARLPLERYRAEAIRSRPRVRPDGASRLDDTQELTLPAWVSSAEGAASVDSWLPDGPPAFDWGD